MDILWRHSTSGRNMVRAMNGAAVQQIMEFAVRAGNSWETETD